MHGGCDVSSVAASRPDDACLDGVACESAAAGWAGGVSRGLLAVAGQSSARPRSRLDEGELEAAGSMTDRVRSSDGSNTHPSYHGGDDYDQHQRQAVRVECECCGQGLYMTAIKARCVRCLTVPDATGHA